MVVARSSIRDPQAIVRACGAAPEEPEATRGRELGRHGCRGSLGSGRAAKKSGSQDRMPALLDLLVERVLHEVAQVARDDLGDVLVGALALQVCRGVDR